MYNLKLYKLLNKFYSNFIFSDLFFVRGQYRLIYFNFRLILLEQLLELLFVLILYFEQGNLNVGSVSLFFEVLNRLV